LNPCDADLKGWCPTMIGQLGSAIRCLLDASAAEGNFRIQTGWYARERMRSPPPVAVARRAQRPQPVHDVSDPILHHFRILSILCKRGVTFDHRHCRTGCRLGTQRQTEVWANRHHKRPSSGLLPHPVVSTNLDTDAGLTLVAPSYSPAHESPQMDDNVCWMLRRVSMRSR
jgi:hypothetical protein